MIIENPKTAVESKQRPQIGFKPQNQMRSKKVKYPLFEQCAELEKIQFWKIAFTNCAYGQFPKGVIFREDTLFYRKKARAEPKTFRIPSNPEEAIEVLKEIFKTHIGIVSMNELTEEYLRNCAYMESKVKMKNDILWKEIRAPTTKLHMISLYVSKIQQQTGSSRYLAEQMYVTIVVGLAIGTLIPEDIILENCSIAEIKNLQLNEDGYSTVRTAEYIEEEYEPPMKQQDRQRLMPIWHKYVQEYTLALKRTSVV
ncbi:MAG: hypothetical protein ACMG6E_02160 [Candidatus Roizmanbacteria bacterium]